MKLTRIILSLVFLVQAVVVFSQNNATEVNATRTNAVEEKSSPRTAPVYYKDAKLNAAELKEGDMYKMRTVGSYNTNAAQRTAPVQANAADGNSATTNSNTQGTRSSNGNTQPASTGRTAPVIFNNTKPSK